MRTSLCINVAIFSARERMALLQRKLEPLNAWFFHSLVCSIDMPHLVSSLCANKIQSSLTLTASISYFLLYVPFLYSFLVSQLNSYEFFYLKFLCSENDFLLQIMDYFACIVMSSE